MGVIYIILKFRNNTFYGILNLESGNDSGGNPLNAK